MLALPRPAKPVQSAAYFGTAKPVRFTVEKDAVVLRLDPASLDPVDTIVVLELGK